MHREKFNFSDIKIYDTSMFPKVSREDFLKESHLYQLNLALKPYEKYIKFTEDYLDNQAENFQRKHLESLQNENKDWRKSEEFAQQMLEIDNEFAQRFRESIIVQLFSFFERTIVSSCEMYYSNKEINESNFDGTPDKAGFDYAKTFLKKNAGINLKDINDVLDFFAKLNTLRNRIVHDQTFYFYDEEKIINDLRALSKNRFKLVKQKTYPTMFHIYFDEPKFSLEIIEKIKSLYHKLGQNGVYY
ncbi:MAG: hypothetical protein WBA61_16205 [Aequorivita sp.]